MENTYDNEVFRTTIFRHTKKLNIHASAADLLHRLLEQQISIGANADIAKMKRDKEVGAMLTVSAKITEREEKISPCSFYGQLPNH